MRHSFPRSGAGIPNLTNKPPHYDIVTMPSTAPANRILDRLPFRQNAASRSKIDYADEINARLKSSNLWYNVKKFQSVQTRELRY
ncbi:hypothetical protein EVAR_27680_1 [Eumeta japonica]|uniref:Uncharacterized protein n=1 Tax=Eumeta variegata TaxID=151549 RepID=A0A4C2A718_EUMVA|nr:hypothetical protein EVAR_27680_1 [Eumeta japonica]